MTLIECPLCHGVRYIHKVEKGWKKKMAFELSDKGFNVSKIAKMLNIHQATVRRYLSTKGL